MYKRKDVQKLMKTRNRKVATLGYAIGTVLAAAAVIGIALGAFWLFWYAWSVFMPMFFVGAPTEITQPDFWVFVGVAVLIRTSVKFIFGK